MPRHQWNEVLLHEYAVWKRTPPDGIVISDNDPEKAGSQLKAAIEELSQGANTVLFDQHGVPSVMVRVPAMRSAELLGHPPTDAGDVPPAFQYGDQVIPELWVGKYLTTMWQGHAASLPMEKPERFDDSASAEAASRRKGAGWCMTPFQLRAALALACLRGGTLPHGNNNRGQDYTCPSEKGQVTEDGTVLTGSGPVDWSHNGRADGIWDMNGNLNERDIGLRLVKGEIQVRDMRALCRESVLGCPARWSALDRRGNLIPAGSAGALHYDVKNGDIELTDHPVQGGIGNCAFDEVRLDPALEPADQLRLWGLCPPTIAERQKLGWRWADTNGEACPLCGGAYMVAEHAGVFFAGMTKSPTCQYRLAGMRLMYVDPRWIKEAERA